MVTSEPTRHVNEDELADEIVSAQRQNDASLLRRLCFVRNLYAGDSATEAGRRVCVSSATASRWANRWDAAGVDGLRRSSRDGRPSKLTERQRNALTAALEARPQWTAGEIQRLIEWAFDVSYSVRHVYRIVDDLGLGRRLGDTGSGTDGHDEFSEDAAVRAAISPFVSDDPGRGG